MKNTFGDSLTVTLFGESHGEAIGAVLDGIAPGVRVDCAFIEKQLLLRRPAGAISTSRKEADKFRILSGVVNGFTCGTPICIVIENGDIKPEDYSAFDDIARPSHADFTARQKYHGFEAKSGGGHFSGRITAALVAAAGIVIPALNRKGVYIGTHIKKLGGVSDRDFADFKQDIAYLSDARFAVLDTGVESKMRDKIVAAANEGDSIGAILETAVYGMPAGVGEPWFDTVEGKISHAVFSVPAIKGIEFGAGFGISDMKGSNANDPFVIENGEIKTASNNNGGVLGGITSGMPIVFRCAVKPTPTICKEQKSVDMKNMTAANIIAAGRHDPCIAHRARVVVDSVTALALADSLTVRFGTDWLA